MPGEGFGRCRYTLAAPAARHGRRGSAPETAPRQHTVR
jgi:hypothetical protein